ncbi:MAG: hypothetical protein ACRD3Q_06750, partial [Terriglobales bacterium]
MQSSTSTRCNHIRPTGLRCGSLALRDHRYCYYHQRSRPLLVNFRGPAHEPDLMSLPLFEDAHSIQSTLHSIVFRLLEKNIDTKKAGLILYALQIASSNLKHMKAEAPNPDEVVVDLPRLSELPPSEKLNEPERMNSHSLQQTMYPYTPSDKDVFYDDVMRQQREMREHPENLVEATFSPDLPPNLAKAEEEIEGDYRLQQEEKAKQDKRRQDEMKRCEEVQRNDRDLREGWKKQIEDENRNNLVQTAAANQAANDKLPENKQPDKQATN